ncbi:MAG: ATP-binding protein [Acidobacteriia bacterium]|nr:ATP-binding protein [Terriglobia bacterium]
MDRTLPKRLFRFPPTFAQNLTVLLISLVGIVLVIVHESYREGLTVRIGVTIALLAALSAATGMLIYQERRSWVLLRDFRSAIAKIAPTYARLTASNPLTTGTEGLEKEIRTLTERWAEFCLHCQRVHDAEMVHAEHLATLGEIAAGVAHEIRNPLAGIAGAIEIITKDFPKDHPDREVLEDLRQEVRRIEKTLSELLVYARPKPPQFGEIDIKETIARTLQLARQQTGTRKVEFSIQIAPSFPPFLADAEQLHQVLLNLVLNSIQAIEREGKISIEAGLSDGDVPNRPGAVEITVTDNGPGIPPEHLDRIFRPFYTTKRGGTGLGLSLCRRIIAAHGGTLSAESELKKGSRFVIRLPLRKAVEEKKQVYA